MIFKSKKQLLATKTNKKNGQAALIIILILGLVFLFINISIISYNAWRWQNLENSIAKMNREFHLSSGALWSLISILENRTQPSYSPNFFLSANDKEVVTIADAPLHLITTPYYPDGAFDIRTIFPLNNVLGEKYYVFRYDWIKGTEYLFPQYDYVHISPRDRSEASPIYYRYLPTLFNEYPPNQ